MPAKKGMTGYDYIARKAEKGEYTLVAPGDYMILGFLNPEGTMFADVYPEGHTTAQVARELFQNKISAAVLGPRMATLRAQKLIVSLKGVGRGGNFIYQVTTKGREVLHQWQAQNGSKT